MPAIPKEKEPPKPDDNIDTGNHPSLWKLSLKKLLFEPVIAAELVDDITPQIIDSTVRHGDIDVDPNIDRLFLLLVRISLARIL